MFKLDYTDIEIADYINELFANDKIIEIYLSINMHVKSFTQLLEKFDMLDGTFNFDKSKACFIFQGKISTLLKFLKAEFFDVKFEYFTTF